MERVDLRNIVLPAFLKGYWFNTPEAGYRVFVGARGTGKSTNILGFESVLKIISDPTRNCLFVRKNDTDNSKSTYNSVIKAIRTLKLDKYFKATTNPNRIRYLPTNQIMFFAGFNNPTGLTSIEPIVGKLTDVYCEEASELDSWDDFRLLDGSIRAEWTYGGKVWHSQITFLLNPWDIGSWIAEKFCLWALEEDEEYMENHSYQDYYDPDFTFAGAMRRGLYVQRTAFTANPYLPSDRKDLALTAKMQMPLIYKTEWLGLWGNTNGVAYPEWTRKIVKPWSFYSPDYKGDEWQKFGSEQFRFGAYAIGIDTGLSDGEGKIRADGRDKSATACVLVGIAEDYSAIVALDEWYWTNNGKASNEVKSQITIWQEIVEWLAYIRQKYGAFRTIMKGRVSVYVDNADKGSIDGLTAFTSRKGLANFVFIPSTKIAIRTRVDFMRVMMATDGFFVSDTCKNLIKEIEECKKGVRGQPRDGIGDHAINAFEYAWTPFRQRIKKFNDFKER